MLPDNPKTVWPPEQWAGAYADMAESAAWYAGDMNALATIYAGRIYSPYKEHSFNTSRSVGEDIRSMVHVPVCADIAGTSAAMLFGEHPKITIQEAHEENPPADAVTAQEWLDDMAESTDLLARVSEAADVCSGIGGVYLKVDWDRELSEYPIVNIAQPDNAVPEFAFGYLRACTFWRVVHNDGSRVLRLLERHEPGVIYSGLYSGTTELLGSQIGLESHPDSANLLPMVSTGIDQLACVYVPNIKPNRRRRGSGLGQADTAGMESLMNSLDYTYTALLRDIRVGLGRIMAPMDYFETDASGTWAFDEFRESYMKLDAMPGSSGMTNDITVSQFAIRTTEHLDAAQGFLRQIYSGAAYSPQSFGLDIGGAAESGTALKTRERKSIQTTSKKGDYWSSRLTYIINAAMDIARAQLGAKIQQYEASVELQDSAEGDITTVAQSVELLKRAEAASVKTRIRMVHPDWSASEVNEEAERIEDESGMSVPSIEQNIGAVPGTQPMTQAADEMMDNADTATV